MEDRWFLPSGIASAADRLSRAEGRRPRFGSWLYRGLLHACHLAVDVLSSRERSRGDAQRGGADPFVRRLPQVSDRWLAEHSRRAGTHGQQP
jgi:hypothetical protein